MNYRQLYYFVTIVESGNITAAAKKLELSQPPLSKQIMALEEELGIKLMERSSRKITLTDAGFLMYQRRRDDPFRTKSAGRFASGHHLLLRKLSAQGLSGGILRPVSPCYL